MEIDLTQIVTKTDCTLDLVYGDRGVQERERVLSELGLPSNIKDAVGIHIIKNSCHFPMIENSTQLADLLKDILFKEQ